MTHPAIWRPINRFRERWNELLEQRFMILHSSDELDERLILNTFLMQYCDSMAGELELAEYIRENKIRAVHSPHDPQLENGITGYLNIRFPDNKNKKKLKVL